MREKIIENGALSYIRACLKGWVQKINSGAMTASYTNKGGNTKFRKIKLADRGTPDLIACIPVEISSEMVGKTVGVFVGVEMKKDAEEVRKWKDCERKFPDLPKSKERELHQIMQKKSIEECGGLHVITCNPEEIESEIRAKLFGEMGPKM